MSKKNHPSSFTHLSQDEAREFAESIINTVREPLLVLDQDLRVIKVSRSFYDFFKVKPEDTVGQLIYDLGNRQWDIPKLRVLLETILPKKSSFDNYEVEHDFATIGRRIMLLNARQIQRGLGKESIILLAIEDITLRKWAEDANLRRMALFVKDSNDAITIMDFEGRITAWNHGAELMYGYSEEEALQMNLWRITPQDKIAEKKAVIDRLIVGEMISSFETQRVTKDGRILDVWLTVTKLVDETGKPIGIASTERDITERKHAEEKQKKLEEQLRQSQKLEAIGQLSSGVAHDFNNLLGGIMGHAELLKMGLESDSPLMRHPEDIISYCTKAADLTRQLLSFARKAPVDLQKVDLNAFLKQVKKLLDRTIDQRIEIVADIQEQPVFISGDSNQLENAILNIAINARDAMPEGGRLQITIKTVDLNQTALPLEHFEILEGSYAMVSIADTGTGMSKEIKDRIFEPFFTTKEVGKGTGLGLASVYGCVKQHNGYITVESEIGKGTVFNIYLPLIKPAVPVARLEYESALTPGTGTLLVVDDEEMYHRIVTEIFGELGYTVHCCTAGSEAVAYYREHTIEVDVVILDMNMPKMNGLQCFRELKAINADVKVIVSSGYGDNNDRQIMQKEGLCAFVQKPYRAADLAKKIKVLTAV